MGKPQGTCTSGCIGNNPFLSGSGRCYSHYAILDIAYAIPGLVAASIMAGGNPLAAQQIGLYAIGSYLLIRQVILPKASPQERLILRPPMLIGFGAGYFAGISGQMGLASSVALGVAGGALMGDVMVLPQADEFAVRVFAHERDMLSAGFDGTPGLHRNPVSLQQDP